jgi:CTP synthase
LGLESAHTTEIDAETGFPVIDLMEDQKEVNEKGGTMRLGSYPCVLKDGTKVKDIYGVEKISERHRHRFEFNNKYLDQYQESGMIAAGINPNENLVEIIELINHPWFVGVQFHPEYRSTVANPHPLFVEFVRAAKTYSLSK